MYLIFSLVISFATVLFEILKQGEGIVVVPYGIVIPILASTPRLVFGRVQREIKRDILRRIEFFTFVAVLFNAPASLFLHDLGFQYDRFLHFSMGFISLPICYFLLFFVYGEKVSKKKLLLISFTVIFIGLFAFEGLQFSVDQVFGTKLFFDASQPITRDFIEDILFGFAGLSLSLFYTTHLRKLVL